MLFQILKKEAQERARTELAKVTYVLSVREVLALLQDEKVLADIKEGANGAPKLSSEQLQTFRQLATPSRENEDSFEKQVAASAEHLVNIAEQKVRWRRIWKPKMSKRHCAMLSYSNLSLATILIIRLKTQPIILFIIVNSKQMAQKIL